MDRAEDRPAVESTGPFGLLASLYDSVAPAVRRNGLVYPVALDPLDSVSLVPAGDPPTAVVRTAYGDAHLRGVRERHAAAFDGPVLVLDAVQHTTLRVRPSSYFDVLATCDALRAEVLGAVGRRAALPARDAAHAAAGSRDPVRHGAGRAAAIGVSVVTTLPTRSGRAFVLGRRWPSLPADPGLWHVAPSGMLQPGVVARVVALAVEREIGEELAVPPAIAAALADRARVVGLAHDLTRLRPDICLVVDLTAAEAAALAPTLSAPPRGSEFTAFELVEVTSDGLAAFWRNHAPHTITPAAAGAVALFESAIAR